jgi:arginase
MSLPLTVIGAPSSAGAYAPGQEKAPAAFRRGGLIGALQSAGRQVDDDGDISPFRWRPDPRRPKAMNLEAVQSAARALADRVAGAMAGGRAVLVLGGDCTLELGTVAGAQHDGASVGLVYLDLDVDLNSPEQSDGALDWTVTAHLLELPGTAPELSRLGPRAPMLAAADLLFFAADAITPVEQTIFERLAPERIALAEVKANPAEAARRAARWGSRFDRLLVHLDVDVLEFADFPIAENVRRQPGLTLAELSAALPPLLAAPNWRALTVTEVNPDHAPDEAQSFHRLIQTLCSALAS